MLKTIPRAHQKSALKKKSWLMLVGAVLLKNYYPNSFWIMAQNQHSFYGNWESVATFLPWNCLQKGKTTIRYSLLTPISFSITNRLIKSLSVAPCFLCINRIIVGPVHPKTNGCIAQLNGWLIMLPFILFNSIYHNHKTTNCINFAAGLTFH